MILSPSNRGQMSISIQKKTERRPFSGGFLVYFISGFFKLLHFHMCVFEEEINVKKQHFLFSSFFFVWILTFVLY
jgi:hypothetical protein